MFLDPIERKSEIESVCMYGVSVTPGKGTHRGMRWELKTVVDQHSLGYAGNKTILHIDLETVTRTICTQSIIKFIGDARTNRTNRINYNRS